MTRTLRLVIGVWLMVFAIMIALEVGAPLPGGAIIAIGSLAIGGIIMIARTGVLELVHAPLREHFPRSGVEGPRCVECGQVWPCEAAQR